MRRDAPCAGVDVGNEVCSGVATDGVLEGASQAQHKSNNPFITRRMQRIVGERERGTVHGGCIRLLPPKINWAHRLVAVLSF